MLLNLFIWIPFLRIFFLVYSAVIGNFCICFLRAVMRYECKLVAKEKRIKRNYVSGWWSCDGIGCRVATGLALPTAPHRLSPLTVDWSYSAVDRLSVCMATTTRRIRRVKARRQWLSPPAQESKGHFPLLALKSTQFCLSHIRDQHRHSELTPEAQTSLAFRLS